ncbi:MAG: thioesterase [Acidimicrobiia bacterium]|nr:thioesterase [Acidimicrobiia bacterium]
MVRADGATELVDVPANGRCFSSVQRVRLSDTDAKGRLRLDALFRYVQDVANDDAREALDDSLAWVVRKAMVEVSSNPVEAEVLRLTTWCGGYGSRWAERRTSMQGEHGGRAETVALWVAIDRDTGTPVALPQEFHDAYGEAAGGRAVSSRLRHPRPPAGGPQVPWTFRAADVDILGHVNNTAYWTVAEQLLDDRPVRYRAEIEFRNPTNPGVELGVLHRVDTEGIRAWILDGAVVCASLLVIPLDDNRTG